MNKERILTLPLLNLMLAGMLNRACTTMLVVLVPLYALEHGLSAALAGLTTTFYMLTATLLRPLTGQLVDSRGPFAMMVIGATIYSAATGLFVIALPVWAMLVLRAVQGAGFSLNSTAVQTMATQLIPERRMAEGLGFLGIEQTVVQAAVPFLALMLKNAYGYQTAFAVAFAFGVATVLVRFPLRKAARRLEEERAEARREDRITDGPEPLGSPWWTRIVDRNAWRAASVILLAMFGMSGVTTFLAAFATQKGIPNAGPFFAASAIAVLVSRLLSGRAQRRFGATWVVVPGLTLLAGALLGLAWLPNLAVLIVLGVVFGLGQGMMQPALAALAVLSAERTRRGMANSTFFMAMDASQAVGAFLLGIVATATFDAAVFIVSAAAALAAIVVYFVVIPRWARLPFRSAAYQNTVKEPLSSGP